MLDPSDRFKLKPTVRDVVAALYPEHAEPPHTLAEQESDEDHMSVRGFCACGSVLVFSSVHADRLGVSLGHLLDLVGRAPPVGIPASPVKAVP